MRHLVTKLEMEANISSAPPYPEGFEKIVEATSLEEALKVHRHGEVLLDSSDAPKKTFYTMAFYIALVIAPFDPAHKGPRKLILDRPVMEFRAMINIWDKLTPDMNLLIRDIKRDALPDYLFEGQARPQPGVARSVRKAGGCQAKSPDVKHGRRMAEVDDSDAAQTNAACRSPEEVKRSRSSDGIHASTLTNPLSIRGYKSNARECLESGFAGMNIVPHRQINVRVLCTLFDSKCCSMRKKQWVLRGSNSRP